MKIRFILTSLFFVYVSIFSVYAKKEKVWLYKTGINIENIKDLTRNIPKLVEELNQVHKKYDEVRPLANTSDFRWNVKSKIKDFSHSKEGKELKTQRDRYHQEFKSLEKETSSKLKQLFVELEKSFNLNATYLDLLVQDFQLKSHKKEIESFFSVGNYLIRLKENYGMSLEDQIKKLDVILFNYTVQAGIAIIKPLELKISKHKDVKSLEDAQEIVQELRNLLVQINSFSKLLYTKGISGFLYRTDNKYKLHLMSF